MAQIKKEYAYEKLLEKRRELNLMWQNILSYNQKTEYKDKKMKEYQSVVYGSLQTLNACMIALTSPTRKIDLSFITSEVNNYYEHQRNEETK